MIYRAVAATSLPPAAAQALTGGGVDGVLHFSRRSAEVYVDAARAAGVLESALQAAHYCLSAPIAEPLAKAGAADIRVARASKRGPIARAYCRGLICCRHLCPVLCRGGRPALTDEATALWGLYDQRA